MKIVINDSHPAAEILKLSYREFQVFCAIACGEGPQETADKLGISVKTVSTYRARIMEKLQLGSNQHLALMAYRANFTRVEGEMELTP